MFLTAYRLFALLLLLPAFYVHAQTSKPQIQKEPAWVHPAAVSYTATQLDAEAENGVIDLVYEKQISLAQQATFTRRSVKFLTEAGVQSGSELSIDYDPAFQQLQFHKINIIRQGRAINKLDLEKVKTVRQEKERSSFIYNGNLTALLLLEDVQKGDILEYNYTLSGFNPVFNGKYSSVFDLAFGVPIYHLNYTLIVPSGRTITYKNSKTNAQANIVPSATGTTYEWHLENVPALHVEDNIPAWYDPYPVVMVSEFRNWADVNNWARALFPLTGSLSPALQAKVQEFKRANADKESQVRAALRFVQDDIRYLGIEMGANSHKPHRPDEILQQRFGDCKDKSYLLCTLLQALGIDAKPVLINASYRKGLLDWLPSPSAFDHTTVQVRLAGKNYWFDPTIAYQRGPLSAISYPDYGAGLVISDTTTALTAIPFHSVSEVKIKEVFNIPNMSGRVQLKVVTDYSGAFADDLRDEFSSTSNYEMRKNYTDFYAAYFKKIQADSLTKTDNEVTGVFTTTEYYTLDSIWGALDYMKKASFEPYVINSLLKKPDAATRAMPYAVRFPARYIEEIEVNLPEAWELKHSDHKSESAAFQLHADYTCSGKNMVLKYEYNALKDYVMPEELTAYRQSVDQANEGIAYSLTSTSMIEGGKSSGFSSNTYASLYLALGLCVFITYNIRKRNR